MIRNRLLKNIKSGAKQILGVAPVARIECWADHAEEIGTAKRQRLRLIAQGLAQRLHESADQIKSNTRRAVQRAGVKIALRASAKLSRLAQRIEQKARETQFGN